MHIESTFSGSADRLAQDRWSLLEGGSVGIVLGFGIDLARLGVHSARRAWAARPHAHRGWHRQHPCDAGSR